MTPPIELNQFGKRNLDCWPSSHSLGAAHGRLAVGHDNFDAVAGRSAPVTLPWPVTICRSTKSRIDYALLAEAEMCFTGDRFLQPEGRS